MLDESAKLIDNRAAAYAPQSVALRRAGVAWRDGE
jgi:hypothetical protein